MIQFSYYKFTKGETIKLDGKQYLVMNVATCDFRGGYILDLKSLDN